MTELLLTTFQTPFETPPFDKLSHEDYLPALQEAIALARAELRAIADAPTPPTFENTIEALERSGERVNLIAAIFYNLHSAETNEVLERDAQEIAPLLSAYGNDILLDEVLFARVAAVHAARPALESEAERLLEKTYRTFVRNGANLSDEDKQRLRALDEELSRLSLTFGQHVLQDTNAYELRLTDEADLAGLPESVRQAAAQAAADKGYAGEWLFTLHQPSYLPFMKYADRRDLRERFYRAFAARGFRGDAYDNRQLVQRIAARRHERAQLLGYATHADFVLEERMAQTPARVTEFLDDLLQPALPAAHRELDELTAFARQRGGPDTLERWDFAYYAEQLRKEKFNLDDEALRPYFALDRVLQGMFEVAQRLFGISFHAQPDIARYHPDVQTFEVREGDRHVGVFYADFFPRPGKRSGAWMTAFRGQRRLHGYDQRPHVSIVCNFTPPTAQRPSLLTFQEVTTLFHEFGHALHGLLAEGQYESLTGTNVYWDFVELPSQLLENWVYERETLNLFAFHYQTGEPLPAEMVASIRESAKFLSGYQTVRQIGLARLDLAWHAGDTSSTPDVAQHEAAALAETELLPPVADTNVSCAFSHIFQGGYAAGYYSYKWAEVLDADAFEYFQEKGIFDAETAGRFRQFVLSAGNRAHPMSLYLQFRGQPPSPEALLRRSGLVPAAS